MRLTNVIRDAFVHAAMQDVPQVDYHLEALKIAQKWLDDSFKETFPGIDKEKAEQSGWLYKRGISMPTGINSPYLYSYSSDCIRASVDNKTWDNLVEISKKNESQKEVFRTLKSKLKAVAYSAKTRKQLVDLLPEFEKYLPKDFELPTANLPATSNVVADFSKAGWPKE